MRKTPTYTPRELEAIRAADRVVARVHIQGEWRDQEFRPDPELGETTVRQVLVRVQHALRHHRDFSQICLYVGGEVRGERMIASVPHDCIPEELA